MEIKDLKAAMLARHSVRSYLDKPIPQEIVDALRDAVQECNTASGLHIQLVVDEPQAFGGFMAHYGKFSGVKNYFALVGPKSRVLDERLGYYGAQLTLLAPTAMNQQKFRFGLTPRGQSHPQVRCRLLCPYGPWHRPPLLRNRRRSAGGLLGVEGLAVYEL